MKISVNIKMEDTVRNQAKELFAKMGLDMTTAVNMFLLTVLREKRIPFEISAVSEQDVNHQYDIYVAEKIKRAEEQDRIGNKRSFEEFANEVNKRYGF